MANLLGASTRRSTSRGSAALGLILALVLTAGLLALVPWLLMLLLGTAHVVVSPAIPALSFWASVVVTALIALVGAVFNATATS